MIGVQNLLQPLNQTNTLTATKSFLFFYTFFQLWFLFWVLTFSFIMSTFVPTDHCDYYLSTPVFPTVILLFSLPSCLARHSPELWRPENNRQVASAVVTNWSDWSNLASCRVDEFQTRQLLSLGHPLGYTSQAVKKKKQSYQHKLNLRSCVNPLNPKRD